MGDQRLATALLSISLATTIMCTETLLCPEQEEQLFAPAPEATASSAAQELFEHVNNCFHCLFVVAQQRHPLLEAGCRRFQELVAAAHLPHHSQDSPLAALHFTTEMIEEYYFGRFTGLEKMLFEAHLRVCHSCDITFENELLFLHSLRTALLEDKPLNRKRHGATFASAAAA